MKSHVKRVIAAGEHIDPWGEWPETGSGELWMILSTYVSDLEEKVEFSFSLGLIRPREEIFELISKLFKFSPNDLEFYLLKEGRTPLKYLLIDE